MGPESSTPKSKRKGPLVQGKSRILQTWAWVSWEAEVGAVA